MVRCRINHLASAGTVETEHWIFLEVIRLMPAILLKYYV